MRKGRGLGRRGEKGDYFGCIVLEELQRPIVGKSYKDEVTVASMHWLSRMAPQQPRKPRISTTAPTTIITQALTLSELATSWSWITCAKLFSSTFTQMPTASNAQPISYTRTPSLGLMTSLTMILTQQMASM